MLALTVGRSSVAVRVVDRALALVLRCCGRCGKLTGRRLAPLLLMLRGLLAVLRARRRRAAAAAWAVLLLRGEAAGVDPTRRPSPMQVNDFVNFGQCLTSQTGDMESRSAVRWTAK